MFAESDAGPKKGAPAGCVDVCKEWTASALAQGYQLGKSRSVSSQCCTSRNSAATHSHLVHVKTTGRMFSIPVLGLPHCFWHAGSDMENFRMIENGLRKTQGACCHKQTVQPVQGETYNFCLLISTDLGNGASQVPSIVRLPIDYICGFPSRTIAPIRFGTVPCSTGTSMCSAIVLPRKLQLASLYAQRIRILHRLPIEGSYLSTRHK